jgi:hypothetical protein
MKKINVPAALKRHAEEKLTETERGVLFAVVDEHRRTGRNPVEISQRDIAKVVGISHQKVSRILELISVIRAADGVIEISGGKTGFVEIMKAKPSAAGAARQKSLIHLTSFPGDDGSDAMHPYITDDDEWGKQLI